MKSIPRYLSAFVPLLVWAVVIFLLSSQQTLPGFETSLFDFILKKTAHVFVYAVLYLLTVRALRVLKLKSVRSQMILPLAFCLIYSVSDELHQHFVPGRFATLRDVGYDMLGVMIVWLRQYKYI